MKVLAFNGSPRIGGNTELLLKEAIRGAKELGAEVTIFDLNKVNIRPCQNCGGCSETGRCIILDDIQQIHKEIRGADRIILASPVFFFGLTSQAKMMIDRCQGFWYEKYILMKPLPQGTHGRKGLLLLVGGMKRSKRNEGFHCSEVTARAFFRTVSVQEHETLSYDGIDEKGAILKHPSALREAYEAGKKLAASSQL